MATRRNKPCETDMRNGMRTCSGPQPHLHRCHAHLVLRNVTVGPCALLLAVGLLVLACALPVFAAGVGEGSAGGAGWAESGQPVGWGIPDMRATAGRAFMYQVPGDVFGTTVDSFKVTEVDSEKLPHWLEFDQSTRTIFGVPMVTDEGLYYISVAAMATGSTQSTSDIFQLEVVLTESTAQPESLQFDPIQGDFLQVREKTTNTKMSVEDSQKSNTVCYNGETRAVVRLSVNVEDLPPRQRVDLVVKFADFVRRDPQSLKLTQRRSSNVGKLLEESVLVAGPGNANISTVLSLHTSTELSWRLSCGLFRGVEDFSKVMEHNAMEGVLTRVLGHGVVGWQVTSSASREQRRRRQAAGFATPMPTPTTTLLPPSSIPPASPVSLSSQSAFSTAPLPSLPSLSTQPLSPTVTPSLVASPTLEATESLSFLPVTPSTGISPSPVATVMPASSTSVVTSMSPLAPSTASTLGVLPTFTRPDLSLEPSSPVLSFSPTVAISGISSLSLPTVVFETTSFTAAIQPTATSVREEPTTAVQLSSSTLPSTGISSSMELSTTPSITAVFTTSSQLSLTPSPTQGSTSALATDIEMQSSTPVPLPTSVSAVATSRKSDTASVVTPTSALSSSGGFAGSTALASASRLVTSSVFETISELATLSRFSTSSASAVTLELATPSVLATSMSVTGTVPATVSATLSGLDTISAPSLSRDLATSSAFAASIATLSRLSTSSASTVAPELATPSVVVTSPAFTSEVATASVYTSASPMLSGFAPSTAVPGSLASSLLTSSLPSSPSPSPSPTSFPGDQLTPSSPLVSASSASSLSSVVFTVPTSSTLSTLPTPSLPVVSSTAALVSNSTLSTLPTPSPAVVSSTAVVSSSSTPTGEVCTWFGFLLHVGYVVCLYFVQHVYANSQMHLHTFMTYFTKAETFT
ncbi:DAG1 [Branchiostoma lanceolatum]|uniref:DAG1 protein n=1 Tax=Branchiostoma lanceolatum TaxID=7740 RepID=A0A8K0A1P6_BRALA|nr:DAG1 [Branchiostoma lanceolatum]